MTAYEQYVINSDCLHYWHDALSEFHAQKDVKRKRLRSCTAWVYETENYYILMSYNTFIACIKKSINMCFNLLRYEYGFTRTSAQHVSKFYHDYTDRYSTIKPCCYTWRPIKTRICQPKSTD